MQATTIIPDDDLAAKHEREALNDPLREFRARIARAHKALHPPAPVFSPEQIAAQNAAMARLTEHIRTTPWLNPPAPKEISHG